MQNLGKWLRQAREAKGLSLKDVEDVTRIRTRYLKALETGDYQVFSGGESQIRGFLRRYAAFLELSPDDGIARYEQEVHGRVLESPEPAVVPPMPSRTPSTVSPARPMDLNPAVRSIWPIVAVVGLVIFLALGGIWLLSNDAGFSLPLINPDSSPQPTATEDVSGPVPTQPVQPTQSNPPTEPAETPVSPQATSAPTAPPATGGDGVSVTLEPQEHVWVRVQADGLIVYAGLMTPGEAQTWSAQESIMVETGNGAAVSATVNGNELGPLGERGEIVARAWGPEGALEVTPP
jgi:cytoskeletal protein RodZ